VIFAWVCVILVMGGVGDDRKMRKEDLYMFVTIKEGLMNEGGFSESRCLGSFHFSFIYHRA